MSTKTTATRRLRQAVGVGVLLLAGGLVAAQEQGTRQKPDLSPRALSALASSYVVAYEKEVALLVAEETSEQRVSGRDAIGPFERKLKSELFLTYLPADGEWIAIRDVQEVDGVPTDRRVTVRDLLLKADERSVAGQVLKSNARYNLGSLERNFNEPTLPLLLLEPKRISRIRFSRRTVADEAGVTLATLSYQEPDTLPLIGGALGPAPSRGEFVIDAATGAIRRTLFTLEKRDVRVRLETQYSFDERLKLWLPSVFSERYERRGSMREVITGESRYSNYRRFETRGRIGK